LKERIKEIRKKSGLSQTEFAERIGLTKNYVSLLETGGRVPSERTIGDMCREFSVNREWLVSGIGDMKAPEKTDAITEVCRQYGAGDALTKIVKAVMDIPSGSRNEFAELLLERLSQPVYKTRTIAFFGHQVSAGDGQLAFDDLESTIEIENTDENARVIYAVSVNGDSMEPLYYDGDVLLVAKDEVNEGDIGIFEVGGKMYVKQLGADSLISINPAYEPIKAKNIRCLGKVIGKK